MSLSIEASLRFMNELLPQPARRPYIVVAGSKLNLTQTVVGGGIKSKKAFS